MTARIKLRRDLASNWTSNNPVLALGEPGLETDTLKFKFGDGTTAWNSLAYAAASGSGGTESRWLMVLNNEEFGSFVITSPDGLSWTSPIASPFVFGSGAYVYSAAASNGVVVYLIEEEGDGILYSNSFYETPILAYPNDVTEIAPAGGSYLNWEVVRFSGGYFITVGYYNNGTINVPTFAYSQDGKNWTRGNVDLTYAASLVTAEVNSGDSDVTGLGFTDVTYNGSGWLFSTQWTYEGSAMNPLSSGGYYVTDLTTQLNSSHYSSSIPSYYLGHYSGIGWIGLVPADPTVSITVNPSLNPTAGSWTTTDLTTKLTSIFGNTDSAYINDFDAGTINGTSYIVVGFSDGRVLTSVDNGANWTGSVPFANTSLLLTASTASPTVVTFSNNNWYNTPSFSGERIVIQGSAISGLNGTFYVKHAGGVYTLYHDAALSVPVDGSGFGSFAGVSVTDAYSQGNKQVHVSDSTGLLVGMGSVNLPGRITAINGNTLTMSLWPYYYESQESDEFYPSVTLSTGYDVQNVTYANGQFTVAVIEGSGGYDFYTGTAISTNPAAASNPWIQDQGTNPGIPNGYEFNFLSYGTATALATSWEYASPDQPNVLNKLILADTFQASVQFDGSEVPPATASIILNPAAWSWSIGLTTPYDFVYNGNIGSIQVSYGNYIEMSISNAALLLDDSENFTYYFNVDSDEGYKFPKSNGTNGQVLTTDGNGTLSWATPSSGTTLPSNASGYLQNDGSGTLSWVSPLPSNGVGYLYNNGSGTLSWKPGPQTTGWNSAKGTTITRDNVVYKVDTGTGGLQLFAQSVASTGGFTYSGTAITTTGGTTSVQSFASNGEANVTNTGWLTISTAFNVESDTVTVLVTDVNNDTIHRVTVITTPGTSGSGANTIVVEKLL